MEHLLFAGYLVLFAGLVTKVRFFIRSGLTAAQLVSVFLVKVMAGIFYGWMGTYYGDMAQMVDTWSLHYQSLDEAKLLLAHPVDFFSNLFQTGYKEGYSGFLGAENSWWNDLDTNVMLKLLGIFNVASFDHYYINVIFYSFVTLFGPIALFRVFQDQFPGKQLYVLFAVFFIPSFIYWTSGLHKEGLLFNGIALIIYVFYFAWNEHHLTGKRIAAVLISAFTLLALRNYILMLLVPALLAWAVARKVNWKPVITYSIMYFLFVAIFFIAPYLNHNLDFPGAVVGKQEQFMQLNGGSEIPIKPLQPTWQSFLQNAPQAIDHSILRPSFSDVRHFLSLMAALETNGLLLLFVVYFLWNWRRLRVSAFSLFCLFFSLSVVLIIGYTVNFLGAVVRYRSLVLPLLFVPVLVQLPWQQIGKHVNIKFLNNFNNLM